MQRFGRSAQKMKDRWGGSFILATALVLVLAWYVGTWLNNRGAPDMETAGNESVGTPDTSMPSGTNAAMARDFTAYFVQVGAFKTEASAEKDVDRIAQKGFRAAIVPPSADSSHFRLFVGPFSTAQARDEAKEMLKSAKIEGISRSWDISQGPSIPASTGGQNETWQKGVATLNTYLQEASLWWESHIAGSPLPTDTLVARGRELKGIADSLQTEASAPAVAELAQLAQLAHQADMNASEIAAAADPGATSFDEQKAMQGFIALLDSYRTWASPASESARH